MSKKGGYKIVSLGGLDLLGESLALVGLYNALLVSHGKPILLTDINIDGELKKDALVQANEGENKIAIKNLYGYDLEIAKSGDAITVSPSPDGIELPVPVPTDDGKIVKVDAEGKYVLGNEKQEVPVPEVADNGKVLGVNAQGQYELKTASSGGTKLYKHDFNVVSWGGPIGNISFISTSATPYSYSNLSTLKSDSNIICYLSIAGYKVNTEGSLYITSNGPNITLHKLSYSGDAVIHDSYNANYVSEGFTDTVTEL